MPVLLQVCAVIVTVAIVAIAIATVRAMNRVAKSSEDFNRTAEIVRASLGEFQAVTRQFQGMADSLQGLVPPLKRAAHQLEALGDRAVGLTSAMLNEVEKPIRTTLAVVAGMRTGTRTLVTALRDRWSRSHQNGGHDHE